MTVTTPTYWTGTTEVGGRRLELGRSVEAGRIEFDINHRVATEADVRPGRTTALKAVPVSCSRTDDRICRTIG